MKKGGLVWSFVIVVTVKLSNGYSIKDPGAYTASFSRSSSSASAFSHASSSSYSFNGNANPNDVEALKAGLQVGAVASAHAGASAGIGENASATAGAIANAGASAEAGSKTGAIAEAGSKAGEIAGAGANTDAAAITGASAVAQAAAVAGSGLPAGAGTDAGSEAVIDVKEENSESSKAENGVSGCSGDGACESDHDINSISEPATSSGSGVYKAIGSDKYTTGYSNGAQTNYAVSGNYVGGSQNTVGGCASCKGPFPGPSGSIHDYKLASSVPAVPHAGSGYIGQAAQSSGSSSSAHSSSGGGSSSSYQPPTSINNLPGSSGSIYQSKPTTGYTVPAGTNYNTGHGSGHISPTLIATLPGPSGSIHDSKPAGAGAVAVAGSSAGSGSYSSGGSHSSFIPLQPVVTPSCAYSPGSPNQNCGAAPNHVPATSGPGLSGLIHVLPGPSGSIYDSKPAIVVPVIHGAGTVAGSGISSSSYNGAGSVTNIPSYHPVVGPACSYSPGSPNNCGTDVSKHGGQAAAGAGANVNSATQAGSVHTGSGSSSESYDGTGSVTNIPSYHPVVGPVCSYTPGSPNKCGSDVSEHDSQDVAEAGANAAAISAVHSGSGSSSETYDGAGSVTNNPYSHPVVSPACTYEPGSPNKCGSHVSQQGSQATAGASANANAAAQAGVVGLFPGPSGSIHDFKPASSVSSGVGHSAAAINAGSALSSQASTGCLSCKGPFPGPTGSIHDFKPVPSVQTGGFHSGVGTNVGFGSSSLTLSGSGSLSESFHGTGSIINNPSSHPVVSPACSYEPGSPNKCGSDDSQQGSQATAGAGAIANAAAQAGVVGLFPGPSGSIHDFKPVPSISSGGGHSGVAINAGSALISPTSPGCLSCKGPFPGPTGSIHNFKPAPSGQTNGFHSGVGSNNGFGSGSPTLSGCVNCKEQFPGPSGSIHQFKPISSISSGFHNSLGTNIVSGSDSSTYSESAPSIHPETPSSGTYYINKPATDVEPPVVNSSPSFSGQIPCTDSSCGSGQKSPEIPISQPKPGSCGSGSSCDGQSGSSSASYAGSHSSAGSGIVYVDKDTSGNYQSINHDKAHLSGGLVYPDEEGSYPKVSTTSRPIYKNAENGGYAVSSNSADNAGTLIGPGTGHLPIESDAQSKPFGTQGAFGGSAAFTKSANENSDKSFGTQGAFGGSAAFSQSSAGAHSSGSEDSKHSGTKEALGDSAVSTKQTTDNSNKPFGTQGAFGDAAAFSKSSAVAQGSEKQTQSEHGNSYSSGDVTIEKVDGTLVTPINEGFDRPTCSTGACGSGSNTFIASGGSSGSALGNDFAVDQSKFPNQNRGSPVKLQCTGTSCGDTEVFIIAEEPAKHGYGTYHNSGSGSSSGAGSGFATGQVLLNQGTNIYDITNSRSNANAIGGFYSGAHGVTHSGNTFGSSGCTTCGKPGFSFGAPYAIPGQGGFLNKLFGAGGLSGTAYNKFGGGGYARSGSYSNAGSYAGARAGSFATAGASASAHAGSYARSY